MSLISENGVFCQEESRRLLVKRSMQYPNVLIDEIQPLLKPSAVQVMNVIVRNTLGRQRLSDEMSLSQIQSLARLSRDAVCRAKDQLETLGVVTIERGSKSRHSNIYTLNIDPSTGQLVQKSNQSENRTSLKIGLVTSPKIGLSQTHPKQPTLFPKKKIRACADRKPKSGDPRVKSLINAFRTKYESACSKAYVPMWGKDGTLLKQLLDAGQSTEDIEAGMDRFFNDPYAKKIGFDIGLFVSSFNRLNSAGLVGYTPFEAPLSERTKRILARGLHDCEDKDGVLLVNP